MGKILETALYWRQLGIATIPISYKSKQPKIKWLSYTERLPEVNELSNWFASDMNNIAIVTGWENLCIIDFDDMDVFYKWMFWADGNRTASMVRDHTRLHLSSRGAHMFVFCGRADNTEFQTVNAKLPKIDILASRKYALLPPSVHPSGKTYEVYRGGLPLSIGSLYDVLPKKWIDAAIAQKAAQNAPAGFSGATPPNIPSVSFGANFDPWEAAEMPEHERQTVAKIKQATRIEDLISGWEESGGNGRWKLTRCPFHDDHNPSFWLDAENQVCGCHAGCTPLPLDVIGLYARLHGIDNTTAIREMAKGL